MEQKALPKFRISNIELVSFKLDCAHQKDEKNKINFGVGVHTQLILQHNALRVNMIFKISHENKSDNICCELSSSMDYEFEEKIKYIATKIDKEKMEAIIPKQIYATVVAIALSTNRGILFSKLTGTPFEKEYCQIIDPNFFVDKEGKVDLIDKVK